MKIYNQEEHLACYCYDNSEKPMIEVKKIKKTAKGEIAFSCNEIVFIMEGQIHFSLRNSQLEGEFYTGQILFMPAGGKLQYKTLARSNLLIFRLEDSLNLCYNFSLERLHNLITEKGKSEGLVPLAINIRLQHFAHGITEMLGDGVKCRVFLQSSITTLLIMIRVYYSPEELCRFFSPILSSDTLFSEQVRMNHLKYRTVNDLATAMNMTSQQFTRRFNSVFGQSPHEWMQQEKSRLIYGEICNSNMPFKEIANRYGFTVQANFNRFCQLMFSMSPGDIRKGRA